MAKFRPGVITYFSMRTAIDRLTDDQAGKLYKAVLAYGQEGKEPPFGNDFALQLMWDVIKPQIDVDGENYTKKVESGSYAAYCKKAKKAGVSVVEYDVWVTLPPENRDDLLITIVNDR